MGPNTWLSVRESCNTAITAADAVRNGERLAYALCRPSGHHTRSDRASGFCYVNNTAVAAQRLRGTFNRVAILDVDAHHGDGTQQIFYSRPDVLTISIHADPRNYYPFFTGYANEIGIGDGARIQSQSAAGAWLDWCRDDDRCRSRREQIRAFGADALVVALGYDAHARDPIGVLKLESERLRRHRHERAGLGAADGRRPGRRLRTCDGPRRLPHCVSRGPHDEITCRGDSPTPRPLCCS